METSFVESADGTKIRIGRAGSGDKNILVIPGLAEHLGRYSFVAEGLAAAGYNVMVIEPRGHGKSGGLRGHVKKWAHYSQDVDAAVREFEGPIILMGHSTGGLIALYSLLEGISNEVKGLVLSAPNVVDTVDAPVKKAAAKLLSKLTPRLSMETGLKTELLSRDPEIVRAYEADPLVYSTVTARWFIEMTKAQARVMKAAPEGTLPLLLQVGEKDGIVDSQSSMAMARNWNTPAEIICYPGLYHEIFNEPEKDQVLADLVKWLDGQS